MPNCLPPAVNKSLETSSLNIIFNWDLKFREAIDQDEFLVRYPLPELSNCCACNPSATQNPTSLPNQTFTSFVKEERTFLYCRDFENSYN